MPVIAAPVQESAAIFNIALGRIDLALRTILRYAISFEVTQVRVHCPAADKLPSADGSALRVELHHAGLHRHPSRARPHPAPGPVADLAGTDTNVVFVARHQTTIGSRTLSRKTRNAVRVMQRGNTCACEDTAMSDLQHVAGAGSRSIERE